nr:hypothetical protein CFP56_06601 [Quercus suber]
MDTETWTEAEMGQKFRTPTLVRRSKTGLVVFRNSLANHLDLGMGMGVTTRWSAVKSPPHVWEVTRVRVQTRH